MILWKLTPDSIWKSTLRRCKGLFRILREGSCWIRLMCWVHIDPNRQAKFPFLLSNVVCKLSFSFHPTFPQFVPSLTSKSTLLLCSEPEKKITATILFWSDAWPSLLISLCFYPLKGIHQDNFLLLGLKCFEFGMASHLERIDAYNL